MLPACANAGVIIGFFDGGSEVITVKLESLHVWDGTVPWCRAKERVWLLYSAAAAVCESGLGRGAGNGDHEEDVVVNGATSNPM